MPIYAHTKEKSLENEWEPLYGSEGHALLTVDYILRWRDVFCKRLVDAEGWLRTLAFYHDMGKASIAFQDYLKGLGSQVDHKLAAVAFFVKETKQRKCEWIGRLLAYAFAGHHSGLPDGCKVLESKMESVPSEVLSALPHDMLQPEVLQSPVFTDSENTEELGVAATLFIRMLHSCLVDADWLATEAYMQPERAKKRCCNIYPSLDVLSSRVEECIRRQETRAEGKINQLRREVHMRCYAAAAEKPGVSRLNVPTGGGKTLASLSYALRHAALNKLNRVIYVIPFTSIIEQTAEVFRGALGAENVIEHHASIVEEQEEGKSESCNLLATENWDAPVIVTTSVQFFESLFASRNARCRKLHNIANSVVVFDEVQSLPSSLLSPCLAVLKELARGYNCSLLLSTATQPTFENKGNFSIGWKSETVRSVLGEEFERELAAKMKRVKVGRLGCLTEVELVEHFQGLGQPSALFIVNLTQQAQQLFETLKVTGVEALYHLSARMCPSHRQFVLSEVRERLAAGQPVVLVATRVIEAGVDISFPVVYRDRCGLDSLAQAAGRCNRHGEEEFGRVYAYEAAEAEYALPNTFVDLKNATYAMEDVLLEQGEEVDITSGELIEAFFRSYYNKREGGKKWDANGVVADCERGLRANMVWNFPEIAEKFRMIADNQRSLLVPYGAEVEELRSHVLELHGSGRMPTRELYRRLQKFSVSVYENDWALLEKECLHKEAGIYMLAGLGGYDESLGLLRRPESEKIYVF